MIIITSGFSSLFILLFLLLFPQHPIFLPYFTGSLQERVLSILQELLILQQRVSPRKFERRGRHRHTTHSNHRRWEMEQQSFVRHNGRGRGFVSMVTLINNSVSNKPKHGWPVLTFWVEKHVFLIKQLIVFYSDRVRGSVFSSSLSRAGEVKMAVINRFMSVPVISLLPSVCDWGTTCLNRMLYFEQESEHE